MGADTRCHTLSGSCVTSFTCAQLSTLPGLAVAAGGGEGASGTGGEVACCRETKRFEVVRREIP
jgi:hypothetical protein